MNANMGPRSWSDNICSGNGSMPSGKTPLFHISSRSSVDQDLRQVVTIGYNELHIYRLM